MAFGMEIVRCIYCGGDELDISGGYAVCRSCGKRFIVRGVPTEDLEDTPAAEFIMSSSAVRGYTGTRAEVVIPAAADTVCGYAFENNTCVTSIKMKRGVRVIKKGAFAFCENLKEAVLPENLREIPGSAFAFCGNLLSVDVPGSVENVSDYAFAGCGSLRTVALPKGVREIGKGAFMYCRSLQAIPVPAGVREIKDRTFEGCVSLKEVRIPDGVTEIGEGAFSGCTALSRVSVPVSVQKIGEGAFRGCAEDIKVLCEAKKCPAGWASEWESGDFRKKASWGCRLSR